MDLNGKGETMPKSRRKKVPTDKARALGVRVSDSTSTTTTPINTEVTASSSVPSASPTVIEATQPTTQEVLTMDSRRIKKPTRSRKLGDKNDELCLENNSNWLQPSTLKNKDVSSSDDDSASPRKIVRLKPKKPLPTEPKTKQASTKKLLSVATVSQDITEGPKKRKGPVKKPRGTKKYLADSKAQKDLNLASESANNCIPEMTPINTIGKGDILAFPPPLSRPEVDTGGLLIQQLQTFNIRKTRQQSKLEENLTSLQSATAAVTSSSPTVPFSNGVDGKSGMVESVADNAYASLDRPHSSQEARSSASLDSNSENENQVNSIPITVVKSHSSDSKSKGPANLETENEDKEKDYHSVLSGENKANSVNEDPPSEQIATITQSVLSNLRIEQENNDEDEDIQNHSAVEQEDDLNEENTDDSESDDVIIQNAPLTFPPVPTDFNFSKIMTPSQDIFESENITNQALMENACSIEKLTTEPVDEIAQNSREFGNSSKRSREESEEEEWEPEPEKIEKNLIVNGENESRGIHNHPQPFQQGLVTKGILKHPSDSEAINDFESEVVQKQLKKRLCFSKHPQIYEVENQNKGRSIALFSPRPRKKIPSSRSLSKQNPIQQRVMIENKKIRSNQEHTHGNNSHLQRSPVKSPSKTAEQSPLRFLRYSPLKTIGQSPSKSNGLEAPVENRPFQGFNSGIRLTSTNSNDYLKSSLTTKDSRIYPNCTEKYHSPNEKQEKEGSGDSIFSQFKRKPTLFTLGNDLVKGKGEKVVEVEDNESELHLSGVIDPANKFVESQLCSQREFDEVAYPDLTNCFDPVEVVFKHLTSTAGEDNLRMALTRMKVKTIGNLCSLTKFEVGRLPMHSPRLATFESVMKRFAEKKRIRGNAIGLNNQTIKKHFPATTFLSQNDSQSNPFSTPSNSRKIDKAKGSETPRPIFVSYKADPPSEYGHQRLSKSLLNENSFLGPPPIRSLSESDFSLLRIGNALSQGNPNGSRTNVKVDASGHNVPDLLNNFLFLNELKDFIKSEKPGAHRLIEFLLADKACATQLLKCVFEKEDSGRDLFLRGGLQMPTDLIASALTSSMSENGRCTSSLEFFMTDFLPAFQRKLSRKNLEGPEDLKDWCKNFLASLESDNESNSRKSRESLLNQIKENLEELNRRGLNESDSGCKDINNLPMLEIMKNISEKLLSKSSKKDLIRNIVDSL